jgi:acetyl esterase/lipase
MGFGIWDLGFDRRPIAMQLHTLLATSVLLASTAAVAVSPPEEIRLWPNGAPGSEGKTAPETLVPSTDGLKRVASIHTPSITVHLPSKETATGAAVIVMPGGGHRYLSIENEGHSVAEWLRERGIAGFVLKYRLAREDGSTYRVEEHALQDAQRAIRLVRSRAREWSLDPERVGVLGFSAGGQLAVYAANRFDAGRADSNDPIERESSRPAFQALIYSGSVDASTELRADAPPAFFCVAVDDKAPARTAVDLFQRLRDAGVSAELHVYARGGHGFGMRSRPLPITSWPVRFYEWMADQGFVTRAASSR